MTAPELCRPPAAVASAIIGLSERELVYALISLALDHRDEFEHVLLKISEWRARERVA